MTETEEIARKIIDALTRERDEARAEVESCRKAYAQMRSTEDEWKRDTLAALKAEADRLRPAAEAWETYSAWKDCEERGLYRETFDAADRHEAAAARARAAKGQK